MSVVYFDTSALMKLLVEEEGSELAWQLWDACDLAVTSRLTYPEVCAAIAAAERNHSLDAREAGAVRADWEAAWAAIRPIELSPELATEAGGVARQHRLRGADAVHLASATLLASEDVVLAAWDRRLHAGAVACGLPVAPAQLPPPVGG